MSRSGLAALAVVLTAGCAPRYVPPHANEPQAVLKLRAISHEKPGPTYAPVGYIEDAYVDFPNTGDPLEPVTFATPIRPGRRAIRFGVTYSHTVTRQVTETTTTYTPCGTGTCPTQSTHTRSVVDTIVDGRCEAHTGFNAENGASYLVQFDYLGGSSCSMKCFRQLPSPDGKFTMASCNPDPVAPTPSDTAQP